MQVRSLVIGPLANQVARVADSGRDGRRRLFFL
jgi:hypothetical protein